MPFQNINRWIVRAGPARRHRDALPALHAHRPVADSRLARWMGIGKGPWGFLDRRMEGESGFSQFASYLTFLVILWWAATIPVAPFRVAAQEADWGPAFIGLRILLLALAGLFLVRAALVGARFNRLSLRQMERLQEWLRELPEASQAASVWMRPGLGLHIGDYRVIRRAVVACRQKEALPPLPPEHTQIPSWFSDLMERLWLRSASRSSQHRDIPADLAWAEEVSRGAQWSRDNMASHAASKTTPVAHISSNDKDTISSLATIRDKRIAGSEPATEKEKKVWKAWLLGPGSGRLPEAQGRDLLWGWTRVSFFMAMRSAMLIAFILVAGGQVMEVQIQALELPSPGSGDSEAGTVSAFMAGVFHAIVVLGDHFYWPALAILLVSLSQEAREIPALLRLRRSWWGSPLTNTGRRSLDEILHRLPFLRAHFAAQSRPHLVQADLAFARQAERKLGHVARAQETLEDLTTREAALEQIPSVAEYRARQLAASMEVSLPEPEGEPKFPSRRL